MKWLYKIFVFMLLAGISSVNFVSKAFETDGQFPRINDIIEIYFFKPPFFLVDLNRTKKIDIDADEKVVINNPQYLSTKPTYNRLLILYPYSKTYEIHDELGCSITGAYVETDSLIRTYPVAFKDINWGNPEKGIINYGNISVLSDSTLRSDSISPVIFARLPDGNLRVAKYVFDIDKDDPNYDLINYYLYERNWKLGEDFEKIVPKNIQESIKKYARELEFYIWKRLRISPPIEEMDPNAIGEKDPDPWPVFG